MAQAVIADIDGTLITFNNDLNEKVYAYLESFEDTDIIVVTARLESERAETVAELDSFGIDYEQLIMKPDADTDSTEFKKLAAETLLQTYNVMVAVDDSADIREAYSSLGITAIAPADVPDVPEDSPEDLPEDDEVAPNNRWADVAKALIARIEPEQERETMTANTRSKWVDVALRIKSQLEGGDSEGRSTSKQEQRIHATDFEIRETGDGMSFTGYAAVFNSDSEPLPFTERIAPGAFKRSLQSRNEVKLLWNHDAGEPLASVRGGTLKLTEDEIGLRVEATLANTTRGRDVAELIKSQVVNSMSFGFSVIRDSWSADGSVRTLEAVRLMETSIVSWPAYTATAGTISVRSAAPGIDADQLADALMRLESGEELEESHATLITDVVAKLTKTEEVQEVQGDILALKKKKLDLLLKEI
jgi:HK97 family phage prohead protease